MELRQLLKSLILPPGVNVVLGLSGLFLLARRPRLAKNLLLVSIVGLYALSIPLVQLALSRSIEPQQALTDADLANCQAIVVLSGALFRNAPEYQNNAVVGGTLKRLQYTAWLARKSGLPVMVSGGSLRYGDQAAASTMGLTLEEQFKVPVRWREQRSRNTFENAQLAGEMLIPRKITTIALVTDASHMWRASTLFREAGFTVVAAPTQFHSRRRYGSQYGYYFYPTAHSFSISVSVLHEYLGLWAMKFLPGDQSYLLR